MENAPKDYLPFLTVIMGRETLHVANGYSEDIYVMIDADRKYVTLRDFGSSTSVFGIVGGTVQAQSQYQWIFADKHGFTRIKRGSHLGFEVMSDGNGVYVTIVSDRHVICHCFPHDYQYSLIVDEKGYLVEAAYGELWKDDAGNNYTPKIWSSINSIVGGNLINISLVNRIIS